MVCCCASACILLHWERITLSEHADDCSVLLGLKLIFCQILTLTGTLSSLRSEPLIILSTVQPLSEENALQTPAADLSLLTSFLVNKDFLVNQDKSDVWQLTSPFSSSRNLYLSQSNL